MNVSGALIKWYQKNHRDLPWRQTRDPYIIWLSEIILQQTRVEQGLPYFLRFVKTFPTVRDLAEASENEVLKLWQGLGYYSRARNMHQAAKTIIQDFDGRFPDNYQDIRQLKGVGDYTASAIASFAFDLPHAVVDGNVFRVLSRIYGENTPIDSVMGKKLFSELALKLLNPKEPAIHNQAVMEFGALVCRPSNPGCEVCPVQFSCIAFKENRVMELPVKAKKNVVRKRFFNYLLVRYKSRIYMNRRKAGDIWEKLYELPLIETETNSTPNKVMASHLWKSYFKSQQLHLKSVKVYPVHKLSHQHIYTRLFELVLTGEPNDLLVNTFIEIEAREVNTYPVSRLVETILNDHLETFV